MVSEKEKENSCFNGENFKVVKWLDPDESMQKTACELSYGNWKKKKEKK